MLTAEIKVNGSPIAVITMHNVCDSGSCLIGSASRVDNHKCKYDCTVHEFNSKYACCGMNIEHRRADGWSNLLKEVLEQYKIMLEMD